MRKRRRVTHKMKMKKKSLTKTVMIVSQGKEKEKKSLNSYPINGGYKECPRVSTI